MGPSDASLTYVLHELKAVILAGFGNVTDDVTILFKSLATLAIAMMIVKFMVSHNENHHWQGMAGLIKLYVLQWILMDFQAIQTAGEAMFINAGLAAGSSGLSPATFSDPGAIANLGFDVGAPLLAQIDAISGWKIFNYPIEFFMYSMAFIAFLFGFGFLAFQVFFTILEFGFMSIVTFYSVPLAANKGTSWITERGTSYTFATGIKLLTLALVVSITSSYLLSLTFGPEPTIKEAWNIFTVGLATILLAIFSPKLATGFLGGGPSLSAMPMIMTTAAMARGMTGLATSSVYHGSNAAKSIGGGAKAALTGGRNAMNAVRSRSSGGGNNSSGGGSQANSMSRFSNAISSSRRT